MVCACVLVCVCAHARATTVGKRFQHAPATRRSMKEMNMMSTIENMDLWV